MTTLEYAKRYARCGLHVFPLKPGSKEPEGRLVPHGHLDATTDETKIEDWWKLMPSLGIGINCQASEIVALDTDPRNGGNLSALPCELPRTPMQRTGGGGTHHLFRHPGGKLRGLLAKGIDVKANGYIVAPPSVHPDTGEVYEWVDSPFSVPLADLPEILVQMLVRDEPENPAEYVPNGQPVDAGALLSRAVREASDGRNDGGFWLATQARDNGYNYNDTLALGPHYVSRVVGLGDHPYTLDEYEASVNQAFSRDAREPWGTPALAVGGDGRAGGLPSPQRPAFSLTDYGNAERLAARHGADLRYSFHLGEYMVWNGKLWAPDKSGHVMRLMKGTARAIRDEAAKETNDDKAKQIFSHAIKSESEARLNAAISLARSEPGIPVDPSDLDRDPYLFTVENGTLDLRTGRLLPHAREHLITKLAPVTYDATARCPLFYDFLYEIFAGDEDLIGYIARLLGYSLTGDTSEQTFPILYGVGANGKSTLLEVVRRILGDYAMHTPTDTLTPKPQSSGSIPNDLARLRGARFVSAVETGEGRRLDESLIKQVTGGEPITARFLRQEFFEFKPAFKVFLATNHKPLIKGTDNGIWRRLHLIPFGVTIPKEKQDQHLDRKLYAERAGILNWMLEGCLDWQRTGLRPPEAVVRATASYRGEMDVLAAFLDECCETEIAEMSIKASFLYSAYRSWCERTGEREMNQRDFGIKLSERGFDKKRLSDGNYYVGIAIQRQDGTPNT